jgi:glycosyltransferase involved in cell wall biosynthesis
MKLGFHCHIPALQQDGNICLPGHTGLFVDSLAALCERVVCFQHSPLLNELDQMDYVINSANVQMVNIGPHTSVPARTLKAIKIRKTFQNWQQELDVMLVRTPTPLLPIISSAWRKPLTLLVVGNYVAGIDPLPQPRWRKELIRVWAYWIQHQQMQAAKRSLTFVNSHLLYEQLFLKVPNLIETRTTTLNEGDFYHRTDTCKTPPYRLLYTGRIDRVKGLFEIVEALSLLLTSGFDVVLDLVGIPAKGDLILDELAARARSLHIGERVRYHGYKAAGAELLSYYRQADIFITASKSYEGFPRTIWEAMASSVPVVATRVGSIPAFIDDAAILVPPKQVPALARAVEDLLTDPHLRQQLIQKGMDLAQNNTLEKRAEEMITHIERWLKLSTSDNLNKIHEY